MTLPAWLTAVLPSSTVRAWSVLADLAPEGSYLGGGTAIAVHLRHRVSRDLDLFLRHPVDLMALVDQVRRRGDLVVSRLDLDEGAQTLNAVFHQTRVQVLGRPRWGCWSRRSRSSACPSLGSATCWP